MSLDRSWYNQLIDDDGSNTVGSVWNKASVDALMDATDTEVNRLGRRIVWNPTVHLENGTQLTMSGYNAHYHIAGDAVHYSVFLIGITVPAGATGVLLISMIPGFTPIQVNIDETVMRVNNGGNFWGYVRTRDGSWLEARLEGNASWVAGSSAIVGQGFFYFR